MKDDYEIDFEGYREHLRHILNSDIFGIMVAGDNGEFHQLSMEEKEALYKATVEEVKGKKYVVCNIGVPNTLHIKRLAKFCKDIGADSVCAVAPFFDKFNKEELIRHYRIIGEVEIPLWIFNSPSKGVNLSAELISEIIAQVKNVVGIKECTAEIKQLSQQVILNGDKIAIFGTGVQTFPCFCVGGDGSMTGWPEFAPNLAMEMFRLVKQGKLEEARKIHFRVHEFIGLVPGPAQLKAASEIIGLPAGPVRPPYLPMSKTWKDYLRGLMVSLGLVK